MKVREMMTSPVAACAPDVDVATVAQAMWERDCGIVPIVDEGGQVVGMITDRDICIALATRGRLAGQLRARELLTGRLFTCSPEDSVQTALTTMQDAKVRRLAVIDASGALQGILSINDVILQTQNVRGNGSRVSYEQTMAALKDICAHPPPREGADEPGKRPVRSAGVARRRGEHNAQDGRETVASRALARD